MSDFFTIENGWKVVLHKAAEGGYWGEIPAMPGCVSEGSTMKETRANVIEAAHGCLEAYLSMAIDKLSPSKPPRARRAHVVPVPHHSGNAPLKQGTLQAIFNATGMPKPMR